MEKIRNDKQSKLIRSKIDEMIQAKNTSETSSYLGQINEFEIWSLVFSKFKLVTASPVDSA